MIINPVVTDFSLAPAKTKSIAVDEDITMAIENFGFKLSAKHANHVSDYHDVVIYVFEKLGE